MKLAWFASISMVGVNRDNTTGAGRAARGASPASRNKKSPGVELIARIVSTNARANSRSASDTSIFSGAGGRNRFSGIPRCFATHFTVQAETANPRSVSAQFATAAGRFSAMTAGSWLAIQSASMIVCAAVSRCSVFAMILVSFFELWKNFRIHSP
jgi:hypothetical protein